MFIRPQARPMNAELLNATLIERRDISDTHAIVRLRPDALPIHAFTPGQFVTVGLPLPPRTRRDESSDRTRLVKRAYSIASSPLEAEFYELFLTVVPDGRLTPELWKLEVGDRCWISPDAHGAFTLEEVPCETHLVLVATGTGVAPYVSMLRTYPDDAPWERIAIIHGARRISDLGYREEFLRRTQQDARVAYVPVLSREPSAAWAGLRGRVQVALEHSAFHAQARFELDPLSCHVFLCGNPAMIQDVRSLLSARGFTTHSAKEKGSVHAERYW